MGCYATALPYLVARNIVTFFLLSFPSGLLLFSFFNGKILLLLIHQEVVLTFVTCGKACKNIEFWVSGSC